jgi:chromosome segregation ATPase
MLSIILLWGAVGYGQSLYYKTKYRSAQSELGQVREQLERADNYKRELETELGTIRAVTDEAVEYVSRERELLITTGTTIQEIRNGVEDLERYCDSLECYIFGIRNGITNNISDE